MPRPGAGAVALVPAAAVLAALPSLALTVRGLSLADLVDASDLVVLARPTSVEAVADERLGIARRVSMRVEERVVGDAPDALVVVLLGGEIGGRGRAVPGEADLAPGEEALLFLERVPGRGPAVHRVVGMAQGAFRVLVDPSTGARFATRSMDGGRVLPPEGDDPMGLGRGATSHFVLLDEIVERVRAIAGAR